MSEGDVLTTDQPSHRPGPPPPPYGFPPAPGHGPFPGYGPLPPAAPAGPVRPRLVWVALTWVLFAVVTVSAVVWGFQGLRSATSTALPIRTFAGGEVVIIGLDPAEEPAIYAGVDAPGRSAFHVSQPFSSPVDAHCRVSGDGQDVGLVQPERTVSFTADGVEWHQILLVQAPRPYDMYVVRCDGDGVRFGMGRDLPDGVFTYIFGPLGAVLGALAIAIVVTIVVLTRRAAARRSLPPHVWWSPTLP